jgi:hypothetical protein
LVGHTALAERLGQNQRFSAAGGVAVTLTMAAVAYSDQPWAMFVPVALAVPTLVARAGSGATRLISGEPPVLQTSRPMVPNEPSATLPC